MNPWWEQFCDALAYAHDETCAEGERCRDRHRHISEAYMAVAVRTFFAARPDLQGELIRSARRTGE